MESQFGEKIRALREKQNLYLRQVAPLLEMDTAQLSKIEKGMRQLKREQIPIIANILKADTDELLTLWLADQIYAVVKDEKLANEAMQVTEEKIKAMQDGGFTRLKIRHQPSTNHTFLNAAALCNNFVICLPKTCGKPSCKRSLFHFCCYC